MRIIKDITEDNARDYFSIIPEENLFDIGREYTRGIVSEDEDTGELCAGIIWELKNVEDEKLPTAAEIQWFYAFETEAGNEQPGADITGILRVYSSESREYQHLCNGRRAHGSEASIQEHTE